MPSTDPPIPTTPCTICVTGHRPHLLGGYSPSAVGLLREVATTALLSLPFTPTSVLTGMALGWDLAIAHACDALSIPFHAYVPFPSQPALWAPEDRLIYTRLLSLATSITTCSPDPYASWKMDLRNRRMVLASSLVLACYSGTPGGTANCIRYARSLGRPTINAYSHFLQATR